jgi:hypothetical protein
MRTNNEAPCPIRVSRTSGDKQGQPDIKGFFWYEVRHGNNENRNAHLIEIVGDPTIEEPQNCIKILYLLTFL